MEYAADTIGARQRGPHLRQVFEGDGVEADLDAFVLAAQALVQDFGRRRVHGHQRLGDDGEIVHNAHGAPEQEVRQGLVHHAVVIGSAIGRQ